MSAHLEIGETYLIELAARWHNAASLKHLDLHVLAMDWEEATWSTETGWTRVVKVPSSISGACFPKLLSLNTQSWCARLIKAKNLSSLHITCQNDDSLVLSHAAGFFPALTKLELVQTKESHISEELPSCIFPNIVEFQWSATSARDFDVPLEPRLLMAMPSLIKLTFIMINPRVFPTFCGSVYPTVTSLRLKYQPHNEIRRIVGDICRTFPNIQDLDVDSKGREWLEALSPSKHPNVRLPIKLPRLRKLHLRHAVYHAMALHDFARFRCAPVPKGVFGGEEPKVAQCLISLTDYQRLGRDRNIKDADLEAIVAFLDG